MHIIEIAGSSQQNSNTSNAAYCLLLPGIRLNLSNLLAAKKFRSRGNKDGAIAAMRKLEEDSLGKLIQMPSQRGASNVSC